MILINRTAPAPSVLSTSSAKDRYQGDVVQALLQMQHGKCCYCELDIAHSGSGKQVEHFRPRAQFNNLLYDWNNLLLACADCNHAKLDQFPLSHDGEPLLLDPSDPTLDPEDPIEFVVSEKQTTSGVPLWLAIPRGQSRRGKESIRVMKLSGEHHIKRRRETLDKLRFCYTLLLFESKRISHGDGDSPEADRLKDGLRKAIGDDKAYACLARTFFREHRLESFGIS